MNMKIDFHCHCNTEEPGKIRNFVRVYEKHEVIACLVGGTLYGGHDMVPNEDVINICARYPGRLYPLVFGSDSYTSNTGPFTQGIVNYEMKLQKAGISGTAMAAVMGETIASWIGLN